MLGKEVLGAAAARITLAYWSKYGTIVTAINTTEKRNGDPVSAYVFSTRKKQFSNDMAVRVPSSM